MTPEETLKKHLPDLDFSFNNYINSGIVTAMKEYGDQERKAGFIEGSGKALDWAAKYAFTEYTRNGKLVIDKDSILSGKTSKDLQP